MLEYPETATVSAQLNKTVLGKVITAVLPPSKLHKFCWYNGDPALYNDAMHGSTAVSADHFGIFAEVCFDNGKRLCFNDGVNVRLVDSENPPKAYQLLMKFDDGTALAFTVAMYGGIILHDGGYDNEYYLKSRDGVDLLSDELLPYFRQLITESEKLSAKAFLATQQRFPGIGNGTLQDILFAAGIRPKCKISSLSAQEREKLLESTRCVLRDMTRLGGRDTEKDIFGNSGGYRTLMSKNTLSSGCPKCGGEIVKEAYMGGSVYYCPSCQRE